MTKHLGSSSVLIALAAGLAFPAYAQEAQEKGPAEGGLKEIVVTAQRQEQNLQNVPVAVTALNTETLENLRVSDVKNLTGLAPNLTINSQGLQSIPQITIRGVFSGTSDNAVDPKIGIYLDGVYIGRSIGAIFDLADIERVEVLRGPQGTLFGRNATGGALSLVTAAPTGQLGVKASASYGSHQAVRTRLTVNLPQIGPLALKVSYLHDENKGWKRNLIAGKTVDLSAIDPTFGPLVAAPRLGARNVDAIQVAAHLDMADTVSLDYRFDYTNSQTVGDPVNIIGYPTNSFGQFAKGLVEASVANFGGISNLSLTPTDAVANFTSVQPMTVEGHNLTLTWEASDALTFKSITGYRKFDQKPNIFDLAGTGGLRLGAGANDTFFTLLTARSTSQKQWTEELQLVYTSDIFDVTAGGFYFHETTPAQNITGFLVSATDGVIAFDPSSPPANIGPTQTLVKNQSYAAYAQATLHVSDQIDVAFGGRYTKDDRQTTLYSISAANGGTLGTGVYDKTYSQFTYTGVLTYRPNDDVTTYAKIASGYVAGGILGAIPYEPEKLTSYEVGLKSELFDRRLRANLAAFYMDYKDLQIQTFVNGVQKFENAGKAAIWGFEGELTSAPVDGLLLEASLGYQNFDYKTYMQGGVDVADIVKPIQQPKWSSRLSAQYDFPGVMSGDAHPFARLDARWRSKSNLVAFSSGDPALDALSITPAHWIVDGRVGIADIAVGGAKAGLSFWVQNLFDKDDISLFAPEVIVRTAQYRQGRVMGVDLNFQF